jgi:septal ring factor EnvC (AmiA/AmiB activator)
MRKRLLLIAPVFALLCAATDAPELRQTEDAEHARELDLEQAQDQAAAAHNEIAGLNAELAELNKAEAGGEAAVSGKKLKLTELNAREAELDASLSGDRAELAKYLSVLELMRRNPPPALFVDPGDIKKAVRAAILIRAITPVFEQRAAAIRGEAEALQAARRQADLASEDLFTTESEVADRRGEIETLIAQKTALEQKATEDAAAAKTDLAALDARARSLRELTRGLAERPPPAAGPEPPNPETAGLFGRPKPFVAPVAGAPIRTFGGASQGWTWRTAPQAPVAAPAQGVVDYVGPLKGWGVVVILRLGGGYHVVLAGLDQAMPGPGQAVKPGEAIGRMAGGAPAPELYFEVRKNGAPADPARWLKAP